MKRNLLMAIIISFSASSFAQAPSISWQKSLRGSNADFAKDIKQTSDGGYVVVGDAESTKPKKKPWKSGSIIQMACY